MAPRNLEVTTVYQRRLMSASTASKRLVEVLGVDVGGSGVKAGIVDLSAGRLLTERLRYPTPQPATPGAVTKLISRMVKEFSWTGAIGVAVPTIVRQGVVHSAANIDKSWIGDNASRRLSRALHRKVPVVNDADAAGLAEMNYGAGRRRANGVVILLTFGTGIGSAVFLDGQLLPNTELGHLQLKGSDAEHWASAKAREEGRLSWQRWASRVNQYLQHLEFIFSPELFIVGGGVSKQSELFFPYLDTRAKIVAATLRNRAGIIGAAWYARHQGVK